VRDRHAQRAATVQRVRERRVEALGRDRHVATEEPQRSVAQQRTRHEPGLGHDLGHPPFGHSGEEALDAALRERGEAGFRHNEHSLRVVDALERDGQVLFRYVRADGTAAVDDPRANPNGSLRAIAGVLNAAGNVAGLMPHPERASEAILGSADGLGILRSLVDSAGRSSERAGQPVEVVAR